MIIDDKVMTLREVSEYLKVHPSTIYRQLKRGLIPAFKVGSDWRFKDAHFPPPVMNAENTQFP